MAVPKRKKSRARTRHRKAQWRAAPLPSRARCTRCQSPVRPHTVCATCGQYGGRQVLQIED